MKLFYSPPSPFAAKVRLAAHHCGLAIESVAVDTAAEPGELLAANPIGKIPTLVLDDGTGLFDSRVICEYLDRLSGNVLIPQGDEAWARARRVEALADAVGDAIILRVYEMRYRPEDKRHQPWIDKQWKRGMRILDTLEAELDELSETPNLGHFALAAVLGWLDLRFAGEWDAGHPRLKNWLDGFETSFPAFADLRPKAA